MRYFILLVLFATILTACRKDKNQKMIDSIGLLATQFYLDENRWPNGMMDLYKEGYLDPENPLVYLDDNGNSHEWNFVWSKGLKKYDGLVVIQSYEAKYEFIYHSDK